MDNLERLPEEVKKPEALATRCPDGSVKVTVAGGLDGTSARRKRKRPGGKDLLAWRLTVRVSGFTGRAGGGDTVLYWLATLAGTLTALNATHKTRYIQVAELQNQNCKYFSRPKYLEIFEKKTATPSG